jgi:regulation of enolase protein 1 (concanavalin A-like superfamily)
MLLPKIGRAVAFSNEFKCCQISEDGILSISSGAGTDRFFDPAGDEYVNTSPVVWFDCPKGDFAFGAEVEVELNSTFDAAGLMMRSGADWWAKCVHELSPQGDPMVVTIIASPKADDANGAIVPGRIRLRGLRKGSTIAFHWSVGNSRWNLVRYAQAPRRTDLQIGFTVQSPTGPGCEAKLSDFFMSEFVPDDLRSGE